LRIISVRQAMPRQARRSRPALSGDDPVLPEVPVDSLEHRLRVAIGTLPQDYGMIKA
jgi:hypothetical protein